jgi:hypothetical protein
VGLLQHRFILIILFVLHFLYAFWPKIQLYSWRNYPFFNAILAAAIRTYKVLQFDFPIIETPYSCKNSLGERDLYNFL